MNRLLRSIVVPIAVPIAVLLASACGTDLFDRYDSLSREKRTESAAGTWTPTDCSISQVVLKSFAILTSANNEVLSDLKFAFDGVANDSIYCYTALVSHYYLPKDSLIASWDCVAAKVTVDGTDQLPGVTANDFSDTLKYRLYASDGSYRIYGLVLKQGSYTGLPVISLYSSKNISDQYSWIPASMKIADQNVGHVTYKGSASARFLYDNSYSSTKKSFDVRLDRKTSMLGMKPGTRWSLVANVPDRTFLRNKVAYRISSIMDVCWVPSCEYCELFVNSEYMGLYLLAEQVEAGSDKVSLSASDSSNPSNSGFLFKVDQNREKHWFKTAVRELPVNIVYPENPDLNQENYAKDYMKRIEQYLYQKEVPDIAYRSLVDIKTFADCWIALEMTMCESATYPYSVWYYKNAGEKLSAGPLLDFDKYTFNTVDRFILRNYETVDFGSASRSLWYSRLFRDEAFVNAVKDSWIQHKEALRSITDYVGEQASVISESAQLSLTLWKTDQNANADARLPWKEAVDSLNSHLKARWTFMDNNISAW